MQDKGDRKVWHEYFGDGVATLSVQRVKERLVVLAQMRSGGGSTADGSCHAFWNGWLEPDVEQPQNILNPIGWHVLNILLKLGSMVSAFWDG